MTEDGRRLQFHNLQELRLFFAVCVVIAHSVQLAGYSEWDILRQVFSSEVAVQGFFILSGFLVYGSFERAPELAPYLRRRVARIIPAYVAAVLLFLCLVLAQHLWLGGQMPPGASIARYLAANLSLLNFLQPGLPGVFESNLYPEINGALWTIKVEMMFYFIVPILWLVARRIGFVPMVLGTMLVGIMWVPFLGFIEADGVRLPAALAHQMPGQLHFFGLGLLIYGLARKGLGWPAAVLCYAAVAGLGLMFGTVDVVAKMSGLLVVILILTRLPQVTHALSHRDISYGIYLSHYPLMQLAIAQGILPENGLVFAVCALIAAMAYGLASWHLIEAPMLAWGSRPRSGMKEDSVAVSKDRPGPRIGIDLHNIRDGGGVNYITNLLSVADQKKHGFSELHLFGAPSLLATLPESSAIRHHPVAVLERRLYWRIAYAAFGLPRALRRAECDLLYAPGGVMVSGFRPYATISRNMMPFSPELWALYPPGFGRLRLSLLHHVHKRSFAGAQAMIYLTETARASVEPLLGAAAARRPVEIIPHGVNQALFKPLPSELRDRPFDRTGPVELIYCSRLEPYKHQLEVMEAVMALRPRYPQLRITFLGWANPAYEAEVRAAMARLDPEGLIFHYPGAVSNQELPGLYAQCHLMVFASACENLPNTVIEAMASGLPVISSSADPMPEIGGEACLYFDPKDPSSIAACLERALSDYDATLDRARAGLARSADYAWDRCAAATFSFLTGLIASNSSRNRGLKLES